MNRYSLGFIVTEVTLLVVGKYLLNLGIHPYFYALVTGVSAAIIMVGVLRLHPTTKTLVTSLPTIFFFTIANSLAFVAIKYSTLTNYNFIIQSSLLMIPFLAKVFLNEPIPWIIYPLVLINLVGITLLSGLSQFKFNSSDALTLLAAVFVSLDFIWQKKAALIINKDVVAFWRRLISSILIGFFWFLTPQLGNATWQSGLILIPISLFYVCLSLLMVRGLTSQPVADFNLFISLSPVLTALAAFWLLNERMSFIQSIGSFLVLVSILVYNWYRKTKV